MARLHTLCLAPAPLAVLFFAVAARAAASPVDLEWNAPEGCPGAASIEAEVVRLASAHDAPRKIHAKADVTRAGAGGFQLHLSTTVDGQTDDRDFHAASCADLAATTAVVLALAVDPSRASPSSAPPPPAPAAPPAPAPPPMPAVHTPAVVVPAPPPVARPRPARSPPPPGTPVVVPPFALDAGVAGSLGILGSPSFGADLGLAWTPGRFRLALDVLWFPSTTLTGTVPGDAGAFSLVSTRLSGCWSPAFGRVAIGPCLGLEGGPLSAAANGTPTTTPENETSPWFAAVAGARLQVELVPHLAVRAGLDLLVPFVRKTFDVTHGSNPADDDGVDTPFPVGAEATLGVEAHFP